MKMAPGKCCVRTLDQKLKIFGAVKERKSQQLVSDIYGVPKSTVGDIRKEQEKIKTIIYE